MGNAGLLCSVSFPANTGYAWDFIEGLYAEMANRLSNANVPTFVAYPAIAAPPLPLAHSAAIAVVLDTNLDSLRAALAFYKFARRKRIHVVYLTDRPARSFQYAIMRLAGVRRIIMHDHTSGQRNPATGLRHLLKRVFALIPGITVDRVLAVSDYVARRHAAVTLLPHHRIERVWNGIDTNTIQQPGHAPNIRRLLGISADRMVIACACRATSEKGVDILFRAFDKLIREWSGQQRPFLAYLGAGPQLSSLDKLRSELAAADDIRILGFMRDAADIVQSADIVVVPSVWQDAFPLSVLEMMARSKAIVATRVGGIPEMIVDHDSGLLVEPGDVEGLCNALEYMIYNPLVCQSFGNNARIRVKARFVLSNQIDVMIRSFSDVFLILPRRPGQVSGG